MICAPKSKDILLISENKGKKHHIREAGVNELSAVLFKNYNNTGHL